MKKSGLYSASDVPGLVRGDGGVLLHKNSFCTLVAPQDELHGTLCHLLAYDELKHKWCVRLGDGGGSKAGKELRVPSLQLAFSLLPSSVGKLGCYHEVGYDDAQGSCGRGLVAKQDIKTGMPIFQEPPLIVAREDTLTPFGNDFTLAHHDVRWQAYSVLAANASKDADGAWSRALKAFDTLGVADHVPGHVRDAALAIAAREIGADAQLVRETLMRFHTNEFAFENNAKGTREFSSSALYAFTSRANHSCAPNVAVTSREEFCAAFKQPYDAAKEADVLIFIALRDIKKGEPLTYCYSPQIAKTPGMKVRERRAKLWNALSFKCGCERCVREAAEEEAEAEAEAEAAKAAKAEEMVKAAKAEEAAKPETAIMASKTGKAMDAAEPEAEQEAEIEAKAERPANHAEGVAEQKEAGAARSTSSTTWYVRPSASWALAGIAVAAFATLIVVGVRRVVDSRRSLC